MPKHVNSTTSDSIPPMGSLGAILGTAAGGGFWMPVLAFNIFTESPNPLLIAIPITAFFIILVFGMVRWIHFRTVAQVSLTMVSRLCVLLLLMNAVAAGICRWILPHELHELSKWQRDLNGLVVCSLFIAAGLWIYLGKGRTAK